MTHKANQTPYQSPYYRQDSAQFPWSLISTKSPSTQFLPEA